MYAKKSLGQNFLKSKEALREIVKNADLKNGELVLEVGPGKGILTEALLESGVSVIAVEKDDDLIPLLQEKFSKEIKEGKLILVHDDILEFNPSFYKLQTTDFKLVANIPYYITGIFLRKFLGEKLQPTKMVIMLQKEVAKRIVAQDKKESILSISVKVYGIPKYIMTVQKKYFDPSPSVDSAILLIDNISKDFFKDLDEKEFFAFIKKAFSQRRKKLTNNIESSKNKINAAFTQAGINKSVRAEDLTLRELRNLFLYLNRTANSD